MDLLKIIQLGIAFANEKGEHPPGCVSWQFNFKFNLEEDMYAQDSIDLLMDAGIDFERHEEEGIDVVYFGELMITSGLVLVDSVRWISFHSGYDFGYLLKLLTCSVTCEARGGGGSAVLRLPLACFSHWIVLRLCSCQALPAGESDFFEALKIYFPWVFDIKFMVHSTELHGGLQKIADDLHCQRIGPMHQAGSDSLITAATFFRLSEERFGGPRSVEKDHKFANELFGLGGNCTVFRPPPRDATIDTDLADDRPGAGFSDNFM